DAALEGPPRPAGEVAEFDDVEPVEVGDGEVHRQPAEQLHPGGDEEGERVRRHLPVFAERQLAAVDLVPADAHRGSLRARVWVSFRSPMTAQMRWARSAFASAIPGSGTPRSAKTLPLLGVTRSLCRDRVLIAFVGWVKRRSAAPTHRQARTSGTSSARAVG